MENTNSWAKLLKHWTEKGKDEGSFADFAGYCLCDNNLSHSLHPLPLGVYISCCF